MQGYFMSSFYGKKMDVESLLAFVHESAKTVEMYEIIESGNFIELPKNYEKIESQALVKIEIGMSDGSGHINWFDKDLYFSEVIEKFPSLEIEGEFCHDDYGGILRYSSDFGSNLISETTEFEIDTILMDIDIVGKLEDDDLEICMYRMSANNDNSIIRMICVDETVDVGVNLCIDEAADCLEEDFITFKNDMKQFCKQIAEKMPNLEITGDFGIQDNWSFSGRGFGVIVKSEANSSECFFS